MGPASFARRGSLLITDTVPLMDVLVLIEDVYLVWLHPFSLMAAAKFLTAFNLLSFYARHANQATDSAKAAAILFPSILKYAEHALLLSFWNKPLARKTLLLKIVKFTGPIIAPSVRTDTICRLRGIPVRWLSQDASTPIKSALRV